MAPQPPTALHLRQPNDSPLTSSSPPLPANSPLQHSRWVFQRSDLPNTTWSSSQTGVGNGEGKETEALCGSPYREEVWVADESASRSSPQQPVHLARHQHSYPLRPENKLQNSHMSTKELVYRTSDYHEEGVEIKVSYIFI